ncbi:MAG: squalene synthase HpnC [Planctomycetota bacterium]
MSAASSSLIVHSTPDRPVDLSAARAHTRSIARASRENFIVVSFLLPKRYRQPFYDLYAFCRTADDLADESPDEATALAGLRQYRLQIEQMFDPTLEPSNPIFLALQETTRQFDLPRQPMDDLLAAFEQDQSVKRYRTMDDLLGYCRCSADPVGRLLLAMAQSDSETNLKRSDAICTALQLTNFWQDVRRDFQKGRLYLPTEVMHAFDCDETMIRSGIDSGQTPTPFRRAIADRCDHAEALFADGALLSDDVPDWLAADVRLFVRGGLATLNAIRSIDCDVLARRVTVGRLRRLGWLMLAALGR